MVPVTQFKLKQNSFPIRSKSCSQRTDKRVDYSMVKQGGGGKRMKMSNIDFLPIDVLAGILTKLPARKLLQLRWVCKNWFGLISDHSFVKMHYDNAIAINHPLIVFSYLFFRPFYKPRVDENTPYELRPLGSCNGLLCISILAGIHMIIWNPCTREYKNIPRPPVLSRTRMHCENYGFGYDCIGNDYKIVRNTCFHHPNYSLTYYFLVDVYTLGTESWKRINGNYPYKPFGVLNDEGVFVNGEGLYWIVEKSGVSDKMVIRFDVAKEEYREISVPQSVVNDEMSSCHIQLIELEGCLCILTKENFREMKAWRMKDYGVNNKENSWTNLFTVKEPICNIQAMSFEVIRICKNGEVLVIEGSRKLVWYNPSTDKTRFISNIPDIDIDKDKLNKKNGYWKVLETCTCIESLVSLNSGTYMGRDLEEEDRQQFRILALSSSTSIVNGLSL